MATKNHKRSMSQPERAFWREAFLAYRVVPKGGQLYEVQQRSDFADAAVLEYRKRVTWRNES